MRAQYTPKIIFSVFQKCNSFTENYDHHYWTKKGLEMADIKFVEGNGVYKGIQQLSLVVNNTFSNLEAVKKICSHFQQEAYLSVDNEGCGTLHFIESNDVISFGRYLVTQAKPEGDYTEIDGDYIVFGGNNGL